MIFQAHIGAQCQADVVALGAFELELPTLNTRELFEGMRVDFYQPHPGYRHGENDWPA